MKFQSLGGDSSRGHDNFEYKILMNFIFIFQYKFKIIYLHMQWIKTIMKK